MHIRVWLRAVALGGGKEGELRLHLFGQSAEGRQSDQPPETGRAL